MKTGIAGKRTTPAKLKSSASRQCPGCKRNVDLKSKDKYSCCDKCSLPTHYRCAGVKDQRKIKSITEGEKYFYCTKCIVDTPALSRQLQKKKIDNSANDGDEDYTSTEEISDGSLTYSEGEDDSESGQSGSKQSNDLLLIEASGSKGDDEKNKNDISLSESDQEIETLLKKTTESVSYTHLTLKTKREV